MKKTSSNWRDLDPKKDDEATRYARPIPSREFLLQTLTEAEEPLTADDLVRRLRLKDKALKTALEARLAAMVRDGQLVRNRRDQFLLTDRTAILPGTVIGHRDGFGFVRPDDGSDDLYLSPAQMRECMHGDRVAVRPSGLDSRGKREAVIVEVLERRTQQVAGRFRIEHGIGFVSPDNRRNAHRVVVSPKDRNGAKDGDLVVVELLESPSRHAQAVGSITRVLPQGSLADTAVDLAVASHQLPNEFTAAAIKEAKRFGRTVTPAMHEGRLDLRNVPLVTIDGEDAKDFDDAVYASPTRSGWRLLVAIADVSSYVTPGSALDTEARERATSVYFPNRVIPMLPEVLSNGLCSLMPAVDRLCMVCDMAVARDGKITSASFAVAVMRSHARLTYNHVNAAIVTRDPAMRAKLAPLLNDLECLYDVYRVLRRRREARGALDFEAGEVKVIVDEEGKVADLRVTQRNDAHRLIEECMIAANVEAARFLKKHKMPALYRVHARPDEDRVSELKRFLATRGVHLETGPELDPAKLAETLRSVQGRPDTAMLESMIIRSLAQAVYQPENIGHFGLALSEYAHFTSPIRRYPDLLVHRAIRHVLDGEEAATFGHSRREFELFGQECSMRERRADEASRDVVAYLKCEFMADKIDQEFPAIVTGVTDFGLFVQLESLPVDGLVHVAALGADYFRYEEDRKTLVGERTGRRFTLGDKLNVRLTRVDPSERKMDFELVEQKEVAFHPRRARAATAARRGHGR